MRDCSTVYAVNCVADLGQVIDANMVEGAAYTGAWMYTSKDLWVWGKSRGNNW